MFRVYAQTRLNGDVLIYDDQIQNDNTVILLSPTLELEESTSGTFTFILPPTNVCYSDVEKMSTTIRIVKSGREESYWEGRVVEISEDIWTCKQVRCEGSLSYLNDTLQPSTKYLDMRLSEIIVNLLSNHNQKVPYERMLDLLELDISDDSVVESFETNFDSTFDAIKRLVEAYGGYVSVSYEWGGRWFNWSDEYKDVISGAQPITFGINLLDYASEITSDDICTVLAPFGAKDEDGNYLNVSSLNEGSVYVHLKESDYKTPPEVLPIDRYGRIEKAVVWEEITTAKKLLSTAKKYLKEEQWERTRFDLSAMDLTYLGYDYQNMYNSIKLSSLIRVVSAPHGLDKAFPVTKMSITLDSPEGINITLGGYVNRNGKLVSTWKGESKISDPTGPEGGGGSGTGIGGGEKEARLIELSSKEEIGVDWSRLNNEDYMVENDGWYEIEAKMFANSTSLPKGIAIGTAKGRWIPGTLAGLSFVFKNPMPQVDVSPNDVYEFNMDFIFIYDGKYWPGTSFEITVEDRVVKKIRYGVNTRHPLQPTPPYFEVYTDSNEWLDQDSRIIDAIYGGSDSENFEFIKIIYELCDRTLITYGRAVGYGELNPCNAIISNNLGYDREQKETSTTTYEVKFYLPKLDPNKDNGIRRITVEEKHGVGVSKLIYNDDGLMFGEFVAYTNESGWAKDEYRYICFDYSADQQEYGWLLWHSWPDYSDYGRRFRLPENIEYKSGNPIFPPLYVIQNNELYLGGRTRKDADRVRVMWNNFYNFGSSIDYQTSPYDSFNGGWYNQDYREIQVGAYVLGPGDLNADSISFYNEKIEELERHPVPDGHIVYENTYVNLINRNEPESTNIAGNTINTLTTTAKVYLRNGDVICMFGKMHIASDTDVILRIKGPM